MASELNFANLILERCAALLERYEEVARLRFERRVAASFSGLLGSLLSSTAKVDGISTWIVVAWVTLLKLSTATRDPQILSIYVKVVQRLGHRT